MADRGFQSVLVIEDDARLRDSLTRTLGPHFDRVRGAASISAALEAIEAELPDLLILDVELPDGAAPDLLRAIAPLPAAPCVIAMSGAAEPEQSFELATLGVRAYLPKPFDLATLEATIEEVAREAPDLTPHLRASVGQRAIHDVEGDVRATMLQEAMGRAQGSKRGAARLLEVSRQVVQHMLRRLSD